MKYLLLISILCTAVFADINFKENRYMAALDLDRLLQGSLKFQGNNIIITYTKPSTETISYYDNRVTINKDNEQKEYLFDEYPQAQYMGLILNSILKDNYDSLDNFFEIIKKKQTILLNAKASISTNITSITINKDGHKNVSKILINMTNKDNIKIEIIN